MKLDFQRRVWHWALECFGKDIAIEPTVRLHRFVEEALELANACGCTAAEAHSLVDYVFRKTDDDVFQEAGGVMVTLALLLEARHIDMVVAGESELQRILLPANMAKIAAKNAAKPKHSPLPQ